MRQEPSSLTSRVGIAGGGLTPLLGPMLKAERKPYTPRPAERQVVPRTAAQTAPAQPNEPEPEGELEDVVEEYRKRKRIKDEDARWIARQLGNFGRLKTEDTARDIGVRSSRYMRLAQTLGEEAAAGNFDKGAAQALIRKLRERKNNEVRTAAGRKAAAQLNPFEKFFIGARTAAEDISSENITPTVFGSRLSASQGGRPLAEVVPPEVLEGKAAAAGRFAGAVIPPVVEQLGAVVPATVAAGLVSTPLGGAAAGATASMAQAAAGQAARRGAQQKQVQRAEKELAEALKAYERNPKDEGARARLEEAVAEVEQRKKAVTPASRQARQILAAGATALIGAGVSGTAARALGAKLPSALVSAAPKAARVGLPVAADVAGGLASSAAGSAIAEGRLPTKEELAIAGLFSGAFTIAGARKHAATLSRERAGQLKSEAEFLDYMLRSNSVEPADVPLVQKELDRAQRELDRLSPRKPAAKPAEKAAKAPAAPAATKPAAQPAGPRTWTGEDVVNRKANVEVGDTIDLPNADGTTTQYTVAGFDPNKVDITVTRADDPNAPALLLETGKGYKSPLALHDRALKNPLPSKPITEETVEGLADIIGEGRTPTVGQPIEVRLATGATRKVRVTQDLGDGMLEVDDGRGNKFRLNTRAQDPAALAPADIEPITPAAQPGEAGAPAGQARIDTPTAADAGSYYMLKPLKGKDGKPANLQLIFVESVDEAKGTFTYRYANEEAGAKQRVANLADLGKLNESFVKYVGTEPSVRAAYDAAQTVEEKVRAARAVLEQLAEAKQIPQIDIMEATSKGRGAPFFSVGELNALSDEEEAFLKSLPDDVRAGVLQENETSLRAAVDTTDSTAFARSYDPKKYVNADPATQAAAANKYQNGVRELIAYLKRTVEGDPQWMAAPEGAFKTNRAKEITTEFLKSLNNPTLAADIRAALAKSSKAPAQPKAPSAPSGRRAPVPPEEGVVVVPSGQRAYRYRVDEETDGDLVLTRLNNQNEADPTYTRVRVPKASGIGAKVLQAQGREVPKAAPKAKEPPVPKAPKGAGDIPVRPNMASLNQQFGDLTPEMRAEFRRAFNGDEQALERVRAAGMQSRFDNYQAWLDKSDALAAAEVKELATPTAPKEAAPPPEAAQLREILDKFAAAKTADEVDNLSDLADEFVQGLGEAQRKEAKKEIYAANEAANARLAGEAEGTFGPYTGKKVTYSPEKVKQKAVEAFSGEIEPIGIGPSSAAAPEQVGRWVRVYHGTPRRGRGEMPVDPAMGVEAPGASFFTDNRDVAEIFRYPREYGEVLMDEPAGALVTSDIKLNNPMVLEGDVAQKFTDDTAYQIRLIDRAKKNGNDGIIVQNVKEGVGDWTERGTTYVVFDKNQIRPGKGRGFVPPQAAGAVAAGLGTLAAAAPAKAATLAVDPSLVQMVPDLVGYVASNAAAGFAGLATAAIAVGAAAAAKRAGGFAQFVREFSKQPEIAQYLKGLKTQAQQREFLASTRTLWEQVKSAAADYSRGAVGAVRSTERYFLRSLGEELADARGLRGKDREDFMAYYNNGLRGALQKTKEEKLEPVVRRIATRVNDSIMADVREPGFVGREVMALITGDKALAPEIKKIRESVGLARKIEDQTIAKYGQDLDDRFRKWFFERTTAERERLWRFFTTSPESMTPVEREQYADLLADDNLTAMRNAIKDSADELARQGLLSEGAKNVYAGRFLQTRYQGDADGTLQKLVNTVQNAFGGRGKAALGRQKGEFRGVSNEDINTRFDNAEARDEWVKERNKNWSIESTYEIDGEPHYTLVTQGGDRVENINDLQNWNIEGRPKWRAINDPRSGNPFKANRDVTEPELAAKQFVADGARDVVYTLRAASRDKERGAIAEAVATNPELSVSDRTSDNLQSAWGQQRYGRSDELGVYRIEGETPDGKVRVQPLDDRKAAVDLEPDKVKELGRNENTQEFLASSGFVPAVKLGNQRWDVLDVKKVKGKLVYTLKRGSDIRENVPAESVRKFRLLSVPAEVRENGIGAFRAKEMNFGKLNDTFVDPDVYGLVQSLSYPSRIARLADSISGINRLWKIGVIAQNPASLVAQYGQNFFAFAQSGGTLFELPEGTEKFRNKDLVNDLEKRGLFVDLGGQEATGVEGVARGSGKFKEYSPRELFQYEMDKALDAVRKEGREPDFADMTKAMTKALTSQGYKGLTRLLPAAIQWQDSFFRFMLQQNFENDLIYNRGMSQGDARKLAVEMALDATYRSNPNPLASVLSKTIMPFASVWGYTTFTQPQLAATNPVGFLINKLTTGAAGAALGATDEDEVRILKKDGKEQRLSIAEMREALERTMSPTGATEYTLTGTPKRIRIGGYEIDTSRFDPGKGRVSVIPEVGGPIIAAVKGIYAASQAGAGDPSKFRTAIRAFTLQNERYAPPVSAATPTSDEIDSAITSLFQAFLPVAPKVAKVAEPGRKQDYSRLLAALQVFAPVARYKPELIENRIKAWEFDQNQAIAKAKGRELIDIENTPNNKARISEINAKYESMSKIIDATVKDMKRLARELIRAERERKGLVAPAK